MIVLRYYTFIIFILYLLLVFILTFVKVISICVDIECVGFYSVYMSLLFNYYLTFFGVSILYYKANFYGLSLLVAPLIIL